MNDEIESDMIIEGIQERKRMEKEIKEQLKKESEKGKTFLFVIIEK